MSKSKNSGEEIKITKQFLLEHLEDDSLDLSVYSLTKIPVKELVSLPRATKLDLSQNRLSLLSSNISELKHLVELDLSKNQLTGLPDSFGELLHLQKLDLFRNQLNTLPLTFCNLKKLRWLDLKDNKLEAGLAAAAGTCLDDAECRTCASNVLVYIRQQASEVERSRQRRLAEEREAQRRREAEEKLRKEEEQRLKVELRKRRQEEKMQARKAMVAEGSSNSAVQPNSEEHKEVGTRPAWSWKASCCGVISVLILVAIILLILMVVYCDDWYDRKICLSFKELVSQRWLLLKEALHSMQGH